MSIDENMVGHRDANSQKICIVYDNTTGKIQHVHEVISLKGEVRCSDEEIATEALDNACQFTKDKSPVNRDQLRTMNVDPKEFVRLKPVKVDMKTYELIPGEKLSIK